ncbi:hypothetical protein [Yersinia kristensenii]|uniref:hypothetical protein n=1 Tax=Yersinia kristensenii TaxID=28152 RepID=UPI0005E8DDEA|nr:hypothetical protein [Yersinia kristensenii]CNF34460.1 Oxygen-regulated invasion protein OrgA [Yersinia kristensenii]
MTLNHDLSSMMQKIIYDPLSWIHPQRFSVPSEFVTPRCRSILNDMVLAHYELSTDALNVEDEKERYLVCHWHLIPQVAWMAVCQRYKASLFRYGLWGKLDSAIQRFALFDIYDTHYEHPSVFSLDELGLLAKHEISLFACSVSQGLKQRIPLLFPESREEGDIALYPTECNDLVMRIAVQYAKRNH